MRARLTSPPSWSIKFTKYSKKGKCFTNELVSFFLFYFDLMVLNAQYVGSSHKGGRSEVVCVYGFPLPTCGHVMCERMFELRQPNSKWRVVKTSADISHD